MKLRKWAIIGLGGVSFFVLQAYFGDQLRVGELNWVEPPRVRQEKYNPVLAKMLSFGHLPTLVDLLWIRVIQDQGIRHVSKGEHPAIYYDLDLATTLDPAFFEMHFHGATLVSVVRDDGAGARDLLLKAEDFRKNYLSKYPNEFRRRFWRGEWRIPLTLAYVYLFDLEDLPRSAFYYQEASKIPGSPPYLKKLIRRFETTDRLYEAGLRLLNFVIESTRSEVVVEKLKKQRRDLFLGQFIYQINQKFGEYLKTLSEYRGKSRLSTEELQGKWNRFRRKFRVSEFGPFGGKLYIDKSGYIETTTERKKRSFGMEF